MSTKNNKIKFLWIGIVLIIIIQIASFSFSYLQTKEEIVYIDNGRLLNSYQGMLDAKKAFENKSIAWKANIDTLSSEVTLAIKNYEKESARLSKKEQQLSQELIRTKQQQLQNYQQAIQQQSAQEDLKMTEEVLTKVNSFLAAYGKEQNYKIIMGANTSGNIIYAEDGLDITDEVIEALNQQYIGD